MKANGMLLPFLKNHGVLTLILFTKIDLLILFI
jgi:hypothetical protein